MKKSLVLLSMLALSISVFGANTSLPKSYTVRYTHNFGRINGFVQIPKGGQFNTTSERRPTFDELNIKNINYPELFVGAKWDNFGIYYGIKYKSFKGDATLNEDLKTHDLQLRKGDKISSKHLYAFHNLGFSYDFKLNSKFTVTPKIEFSVFQFSYKFSSSGSTTVSNDERKFNAGGIRVGGEANYQFTDDFGLRFDVMTHIPHDSIKSSLDTSLTGSYNLYRNGNTEVNVLAGIGYDSFKYRDTQKDMQNFMDSKTKPVYKLGLELKF